MVPISSRRHRGSRYRRSHRNPHIPDPTRQRSRRNQHHGQRRRSRSRRHHRLKSSHQFWQAKLGSVFSTLSLANGRVFKGVRQLHPATDIGVFFCGPKPLGHTLHLKCNEWSQPGKDGTHFTFGKVCYLC
jgi:hypothetical protein